MGTLSAQPLVITQTSGQDVNHDVLGPRHARAELPYGEVWGDLTSQVKSRRQSLCRPLRDDLTYLIYCRTWSAQSRHFFGANSCTSLVPSRRHFSPTHRVYAAQADRRRATNHHRNIADVCTRIANCTRCARSTDDDHHYCTGKFATDPIVQLPGANFQDGMDNGYQHGTATAGEAIASPTCSTSTPEGLLSRLGAFTILAYWRRRPHPGSKEPMAALRRR